MYQVYVKAKGKKWVEYSEKFNNISEAKKCKEEAERRMTCDIHGNLLQYKIA